MLLNRNPLAPPPAAPQPNTAEGQAYLRANIAIVDDVVKFFLFAPPVCILAVRNQLLEQGFDLQIIPAEEIIVNPLTQ